MDDAQTILTLTQARDHLRAEAADDATIADLIPAAIAALEDHLGRPLIDPLLGWPTVAELPPNIVHAVKLIVADLFEDRCTPLADWTTINNLVGRHVIVSVG